MFAYIIAGFVLISSIEDKSEFEDDTENIGNIEVRLVNPPAKESSIRSDAAYLATSSFILLSSNNPVRKLLPLSGDEKGKVYVLISHEKVQLNFGSKKPPPYYWLKTNTREAFQMAKKAGFSVIARVGWGESAYELDYSSEDIEKLLKN